MGRASNDDRSDSMNPNNDAYWDSLDNHADQLNPNNDAYNGDRDEKEDDKEERSALQHITNRPTRPFYTPFRFAALCIKRPVNSNVIRIYD